MEAATENRRYCVGCIHFRPVDKDRGEDAIRFGRCSHPEAPLQPGQHDHMLSPQFEKANPFSYASVMRGAEHRCGETAKWYQPNIKEAVA